MLTAMAAKNAPTKEKDYKLADSGGLHLFVTTKGHKSWRFKYRFGGKEKRLIFGSFPAVGLAEARDRRDEARRQIRNGADPSLLVKRRRLTRMTPSTRTFEIFARAWHEHEKARWKPVHAKDVITSLERDVIPALGAFDVDQIDEELVMAVLSRVEERGAIETAHRLRQRISGVFRYAKAKGATKSNPATDLEIVMKKVPKSVRRPALLTIPDLQALLQTVEHAGASPITKANSRFLALTAQRPGMVRRARWSQVMGVDFDDVTASDSESIWRIPADEMKQEFDLRQNDEFDHVVPLSPQATDLLRAIYPLTGRSVFIFPSSRSMNDPASENSVGYLYNREGFQGRHCAHGWRSSFSTIMNERSALARTSDEASSFNRLVVDLMLAHTPRGLTESELVYNRAGYMTRRRELACEWADLLMSGLSPATKLMDGPRRRYKE